MTMQFHLDGIDAAIKGFMDEVANKVLVAALKEACKPIISAYRNVLIDRYTKVGNSGIHASDITAVTSKVRAFKDGTGAWAVVGGAKVGGQMLAPQQRWGETGTVDRYHKSRKFTGRMPVQHWLEKAVSASLPTAQQVLITRINYLVSRIRID